MQYADKSTKAPRRLIFSILSLGFLATPSAVLADDPTMVQKIREPSGAVMEVVDSEMMVVPFSSRNNARKTPIILAAGAAHLSQGGSNRVQGLTRSEQKALSRAYEAGQTILLLSATTHDIEALHTLLKAGIAYESPSHPVILAYALRQEGGIPQARVMMDFPESTELAFNRAVDIVLDELAQPPAPDADSLGASTDWQSSPVQEYIFTSTHKGVYSTPAKLYALHNCRDNNDYYVVDTGGDWTATDAQYQSATNNPGMFKFEIFPTSSGEDIAVDWESNRDHCAGGSKVSGFFGENRINNICRYQNYPTFYGIDIVPPAGPRTIQFKAAPAGTQGTSATYQSGVKFSIDAQVNVSGEGPSAGLKAGVTWNNLVSTKVPPLFIEAGDTGPQKQGAFTRYRYCTVGSSGDCISTIQMTGQKGLCKKLEIGDAQNGQTPTGKLSDVAQTVSWQVDSSTYDRDTFDVGVTWQAEIATSTSRIWYGDVPDSTVKGYCNFFGCNCGIESKKEMLKLQHTFKVSLPSKDCKGPS